MTNGGGSAQKIFPSVVTHLPSGVTAHAAFPLVVLQSYPQAPVPLVVTHVDSGN